MKLLLTGATGFVGRTLLLRALREGRYSEIHVPVRSTEKLRAQLVGDGFDTIPSVVRPLEASAPDWNFSDLPRMDHVVHSAAALFAGSRQEYFRTNVDGTLALLRTLPAPGKVVVISSMAASGPCPPETAVRSEQDADRPVTWYGQSKLEMETRVRREFPSLPVVFLRPPLVFGARDQSAILPLFKMVKGPVRLKPGFKEKHYSFISVEDLVSAIFAALAGEYRGVAGCHFFVAASQPVTDKDLIASASRAQGTRGVLLPIPQPLLWVASQCIDRVPLWRKLVPSLTADRAKEIWPERWVVSSKAFEEKFHWRATETLDSSLAATRDWYVRTGQLA